MSKSILPSTNTSGNRLRNYPARNQIQRPPQSPAFHDDTRIEAAGKLKYGAVIEGMDACLKADQNTDHDRAYNVLCLWPKCSRSSADHFGTLGEFNLIELDSKMNRADLNDIIRAKRNSTPWRDRTPVKVGSLSTQGLQEDTFRVQGYLGMFGRTEIPPRHLQVGQV